MRGLVVKCLKFEIIFFLYYLYFELYEYLNYCRYVNLGFINLKWCILII